MAREVENLMDKDGMCANIGWATGQQRNCSSHRPNMNPRLQRGYL